MKRKIGLGAGLIFKGSGFYITDNRSEKYMAAAKKDVEPKVSATAAATPAKVETKAPAAAPAKAKD